MKRTHCALILAVMLVVGAAVRLNNVLTFPALRAFDGFGHFTYIWFMADQWRVPLATSGWSFFHPPLYYALMASLWTALAPLDAIDRLTVGTGVVALLGLTHALAAYAIARRYFPGRHVVHLLAAGLMLFLPLNLYTAGFLGNEGLNAVIATASLMTLLWVLRNPSPARGAVLGLCLGAGLLTKFTAIAIAGGALGTLALQTWALKRWRTGLATLATASAVALLLCGWFYARNLAEYGTPFKMSRDEFPIRHVENYQSKGLRNLWEYVLFDPVILRRPQWPRGIPLTGVPSNFPHNALRESVPTGVYANAWFDGGTGNFLPPVTLSEQSRRAGQILLTLALLPSGLILLGLSTAVRRLWRHGWDDTLVAMLMTFGAMVALFVQGMSAVPMHAAVKATYLTPVSVAFAFWLALGADRLGQMSTRWLHRSALACALLAVVSVVSFSNGVFIARDWLVQAPTNSSVWHNLYGIVYYAAGDRTRARELFEASSQQGWHLADENLSYLALQDGRPLEALYRVRSAAQLQPRQSFGVLADRRRFNRTAQAEYLNQMAVMYHQLGWRDRALIAADKAFEYDGTIPEIRYDLAVLKLEHALAQEGTSAEQVRQAVAQSKVLLFAAAVADPGFHEVQTLASTLDALQGNCEQAAPAIRAALASSGVHRTYPIATGPGNVHAAGLGRRLYIADLPEHLRPEYQLSRCSAQAAKD
jgi:tetratricopeptide (TPR) repeat protein